MGFHHFRAMVDLANGKCVCRRSQTLEKSMEYWQLRGATSGGLLHQLILHSQNRTCFESYLQTKRRNLINSGVRHRLSVDGSARVVHHENTTSTHFSQTTYGCDGLPSIRASLDQSSETRLAMIGILQRLRPHQAVFRWADPENDDTKELELDTELSKAVQVLGQPNLAFHTFRLPSQ